MQGLLVVKIGGSTLGTHDTSLADLAELWRRGRRLVVVHGGGPAISNWLTRLKTPVQFIRGLRVTDAAALEVVVAVLAGLVNKQLVAGLTALGAPAAGLSGADGGLLLAGYEDEALGYVGRITRVDPGPVQALLNNGYLPVVAPLALLSAAYNEGQAEGQAGGQADGGDHGTAQLLNVNGDTVAGELAAALQAERLLLLTDVEGLRGEHGETLRRVSVPDARALLSSGVVAGGMIPKLEACLRAVAGGARAQILDGREPRGLLAATGAAPPGTIIQ